MKEITYHKEGDYLIPDLIMENSCEDYYIGKYGRLRLNYIKNYKRGLYTELMIMEHYLNILLILKMRLMKELV